MRLGSENRRLSNEVCGLRAEMERLTYLGDQTRTDDASCTHGGPDVVDPR